MQLDVVKGAARDNKYTKHSRWKLRMEMLGTLSLEGEYKITRSKKSEFVDPLSFLPLRNQSWPLSNHIIKPPP